ncbi:valine--tRNA ligase [Candidatus Woesearchaeota archaeon]|nr:valine--tRNA ligase [Candidatus Woesearchaeota archaeon]
MEQYNPKEKEKEIRAFWEKNKIYKFDKTSKKQIYSIDTPPPTVSGKMHVGHSASYTQQDVIARYKRMNNFNVFYPFGTDDNGLPTERLIEKEKKVRGVNMPRQDFINLCLATLKEIRPDFIQDWKNIGMSCDFELFYSTIDSHSRKISQESFIDLYNEGREYRKRMPFMWCPECQTAIAQYELEDKERESNLVYIKFQTSIKKTITIATTRPELMPACVAIHVHPDDKKYKAFIGKTATIPFFNREVKIYANKDVDPAFGSGAVYHCTFGDMNDAEWIREFKITPIEIMNKDGSLNEQAGKYSGLKSKEARKLIIEDLQKDNFIEKIEPIKHVVNTHERCGYDIEILMTEQWFIKYLDLRDEFLKQGNKLNWHPSHMKNRYDNWVKGLKYDWCISRQRFFGVPIPVWYCKKCNEIIIANKKDLPVDPLKDSPKIKKCPKCNSQEFIPEKDILDTWATSSLTPQIAASLVPELYHKLYPMDLRPNAHDIITFWLFNTLAKSYLHNKVLPWKDAIISGWILDPNGRKMSKSKGNTIDPKIMLDKYSGDALRFWASSFKLGDDTPFKEKELVAGQKTVNKIFNASKFSIMNLSDYTHKKPPSLEPFDSWLISKLNSLIKETTESMDEFEYIRLKSDTENFFWNTFCDFYLEIIKSRIYEPKTKNEKESAQYTLYLALLDSLKLFSPIMPYITEEIYQNYFKEFEKTESIHLTNWPKYDKSLINEKLEQEGDEIIQIISEIRKVKTSKQKSMKAEIILTLPSKLEKSKFMNDLKAVANAKEIKFGNSLNVEFL